MFDHCVSVSVPLTLLVAVICSAAYWSIQQQGADVYAETWNL